MPLVSSVKAYVLKPSGLFYTNYFADPRSVIKINFILMIIFSSAIYEGETTTPEMIARYVSLIPVSTSGTLLFGHFNVWLTCDVSGTSIIKTVHDQNTCIYSKYILIVAKERKRFYKIN